MNTIPPQNPSSPTPSTENPRWPLFLFIYFLCNFTILLFHEPWRDEIQALVLASQSNSLAELFHTTLYEGHQSLWFIILYTITRITNSIFVVQLIHLLITTFGVYLLLRHAPFHHLIKILLIFGFFFSYEYSILFRNYGIGVTLLLLTIHLLSQKKHLKSAICIAILVQANILAFIVGGALWLVLMSEHFRLFRFLKAKNSPSEVGFKPLEIAIGTAVVLPALAFSLWDVIPPPDYGFAKHWTTDFLGFLKGAGAVFKGFVPFPKLGFNYWSTNISNKVGQFWGYNMELYVTAIASFLICCCGLLVLRKSKTAMLFFAAATFGLVMFFFLKFQGYPRHHGYIFIAFIAAMWLAKLYPSKDPAPWLAKLFPSKTNRRLPQWLAHSFLLIVLSIHFITTLGAYAHEIKHPFSNAKAVAEFLRSEGLSEAFIIGHKDYAAASVAYFLDRPFYTPEKEKLYSFMVWNKLDKINNEEFMKVLCERKLELDNVIVVASYQLDEELLKEIGGIGLWRDFGPAIVENESFYLYGKVDESGNRY